MENENYFLDDNKLENMSVISKKDATGQTINRDYTTRDITLVATLKTIWHNIKSVDFQFENGRDVGYFNFEDTDSLHNDINRFYNNEVLVEPKKFMLELKAAKSRVTSFYKKVNTID